MYKLSRPTNQQLNHQYLLILDTPAILSARANNPERDWQNNLQLGQCYIPDLVWHELLEFACQGHRKAKKFIKFINTQKNYHILYQENNSTATNSITLSENINSRNRSILSSALNLANQWLEQIVVFFTYDVIVELLVKDKSITEKITNFCAVHSQELNWWHQEGISKQQVPLQVAQTLKNINGLSPSRHPIIATEIFSNLGSGKTATKIKSSSYRSQLLPVDDSQPQRKKIYPSRRTKLISGGLATFTIATSPLLANYFSQSPKLLKHTSTTLWDWIETNYQSQNPTQLKQLIRDAETAVLTFEQTKESEPLKKALYALQEFQTKNNLVDEDVENYLYKLKHKYAVEVLASSGQITEAVTMLKEIPSSYSKIEQVKRWLEKNRAM